MVFILPMNVANIKGFQTSKPRQKENNLIMAYFQMGPGTLAVPMSMFRDNRNRVCEGLRAIKKLGCNTYILLQGGSTVGFNDTDTSYLFRQESYFQYMFGVKEPECFGAMNVATNKAILFVPRQPEDYATWSGPLWTLEDFKGMYEVDEVCYVDQLDTFFENAHPNIILTLSGTNSNSGLTSAPAYFKGIEKYVVDIQMLYPVITECRVIKSPDEIKVLRYVSDVSSDAHVRVMKYMRPGYTEYQGESLFLHHTYSVGGCRNVCYTCICGSGTNSAILHYGHPAAPNDKVVEDGDLCLFDMGASYCGYGADITCTFPANGKFTEDQKFIYNAVLESRNAVLANLREGVAWVDMHRLAAQVLLQRLKDGGMLKGSISEMMDAGLPRIFQPHGLGHLLGLDVHDVGGYLEGLQDRPEELWLRSLRLARNLIAGMYLTVEPGCYFIDWLMDKALEDANMRKFINVCMFERFRKFGGVRIEDDVLITTNGYEIFTKVPRTIAEIEAVMAMDSDEKEFESKRSIFCFRHKR